MVMLDIDSFKCLNDTYRHRGVDVMLKEFAKVLSQCVRKGTDWVDWYCGDEFLIYLTNTDRELAVAVARRIQDKLSQLVITVECEQVKITQSQGVCTRSDGYVSAEGMMDCADKNLYTAKRLGRNRIIDTVITGDYEKISCKVPS